MPSPPDPWYVELLPSLPSLKAGAWRILSRETDYSKRKKYIDIFDKRGSANENVELTPYWSVQKPTFSYGEVHRPAPEALQLFQCFSLRYE